MPCASFTVSICKRMGIDPVCACSVRTLPCSEHTPQHQFETKNVQNVRHGTIPTPNARRTNARAPLQLSMGATPYEVAQWRFPIGPAPKGFQRYDLQSFRALMKLSVTIRNGCPAQRIITLRIAFCQLVQQALFQTSNRNVGVRF